MFVKFPGKHYTFGLILLFEFPGIDERHPSFLLSKLRSIVNIVHIKTKICSYCLETFYDGKCTFPYQN